MEPWAQRIYDEMARLGVKQAELAAACHIKPGSVSGWFGGGKLTKMISGDNLLLVAERLNLQPKWIMTGKGPKSASGYVSSVGLDPDMVAESHAALRNSYEDENRVYRIEDDPARFVRVYDLRASLSAAPTQDEWVQYGRKLQAIIASEEAPPHGPNDGSSTDGTHQKGMAGRVRRRA